MTHGSDVHTLTRRICFIVSYQRNDSEESNVASSYQVVVALAFC